MEAKNGQAAVGNLPSDVAGSKMSTRCHFSNCKNSSGDLQGLTIRLHTHDAKCKVRNQLNLWILIAISFLNINCAKDKAEIPSDLNYVLDTTWPLYSKISFNEISWMDVDRNTGRIYLLQRSQPAISIWTSTGELVDVWATEDLGDPHSITLQAQANGELFVWITDMAPPQSAGSGFGHCLKKFSTEGKLLGTVGTCAENSQGTGLDPVQFDKVTDVAFDSEGNLFVTDGDLNGLNNRVLKMAPGGAVLMVWSAPGNQAGSGPKEFDLPHAILVDECDRVWIADALNHRIQVISNTGVFYGELTCFGDYGVYGIDFSAPLSSSSQGASNTLFVTTSPTSGDNKGTVYVFDIPMNCNQLADLGTCAPLKKWSIELPPTEETAMLHDVTSNGSADAIYISELGGELPPQKWILQEEQE